MAEDDYHIYKVPRPARSQSFNAHPPTAPLPILVPHTPTNTTQNMAYSVRPSFVPHSAPPILPPRNRTLSAQPMTDFKNTFSPPTDTADPVSSPQFSPSHEPAAGPAGTSAKKWWGQSKTLPRFGSFKEKGTKPGVTMRGLLGQARRRFSDDTTVGMSSNTESHSPGENVSTLSLPGMNLTLGKLTESHAHSFPFQVRAMQSYSFQASQLTIMDSDLYNLYLVKQQQSVSMLDALGSCYSIPVNSAVQFGYINPSDRKSRRQTFTYKCYSKVADLMSLSALEMPRVVCAQETHRSQSRKSSLEENEILLILQIRKSKLSGRRYLKVYSFLTKSKKNLYPECVAHFTTNPAHLRLWLSDMVSVAASLLPCQAVIYLEKRFTSALKAFPSTLLRADAFVSLTELKTQSSVIASLITPHPGNGDTFQSALLDIPIAGSLTNLQIEIMAPHNSDALHAEARKIYEGLDISALQSLEDGITDKAYNTKCLFYTILRNGSEREGVNLALPAAAYQSSIPENPVSLADPKTPTEWEQDSDSDREHYEQLNDWVAAEQHGVAPAFPMPDTQSLASASLSLYSVPRSVFTQERGLDATLCATNNHHPGGHLPSDVHVSPVFTTSRSDEDYEVMELPVHPKHSHNNVPSTPRCSMAESELRTAVNLLSDRVAMMEKVAEYQDLLALVKSLSTRVDRLERQLMPSLHSSATYNSLEPAPVQTANLTHLRSLDVSQVSNML